MSTIFYADEVNLVMDKNALKTQENYERSVIRSQDEDYSDLDDLEFWKEEGEDFDGCLIIRIVGKYLPAQVVNKDRLRRYIYRKVHELIASEEEFSIVYIHTGVSGEENSPGMFWLKALHASLPSICKQRLQKVYILHPALRMRASLWAMASWLGDGTYEKMVFVSRTEFLWDYMKKKEVDIPDFVDVHDKELETRPLMDYGFEVDPIQMENMSHPALGHRMPY